MGPATDLGLGLELPLGTITNALDEVPDRDPARLAAILSVPVIELAEAERQAFFAEPLLSVPMPHGKMSPCRWTRPTRCLTR